MKNILTINNIEDLAGNKIGPSKLEKAEKFDVKIISEEDILQLIKGSKPLIS